MAQPNQPQPSNPWDVQMAKMFVPPGKGLEVSVGGFTVTADPGTRMLLVPKQFAPALEAHGLVQQKA